MRCIGRAIVTRGTGGKTVTVVGQAAPGIGGNWGHWIAVRIDTRRQVEPLRVRNAVTLGRFVQIAAVNHGVERGAGIGPVASYSINHDRAHPATPARSALPARE